MIKKLLIVCIVGCMFFVITSGTTIVRGDSTANVTLSPGVVYSGGVVTLNGTLSDPCWIYWYGISIDGDLKIAQYVYSGGPTYNLNTVIDTGYLGISEGTHQVAVHIMDYCMNSPSDAEVINVGSFGVNILADVTLSPSTVSLGGVVTVSGTIGDVNSVYWYGVSVDGAIKIAQYVITGLTYELNTVIDTGWLSICGGTHQVAIHIMDYGMNSPSDAVAIDIGSFTVTEDSDGDCVKDSIDNCPTTPTFAVADGTVGTDGCVSCVLLAGLVADEIKNEFGVPPVVKTHGEYVSFAAGIVDDYLNANLITEVCASSIIDPIAQSNVGKPGDASRTQPGKDRQ